MMHINNFVFGIAFLLFSTGSTVTFAQHAASPLPVSKHAFIVISHRASHLKFPENTLVAIEDGIRAGVDYVELDLRTTKDGYLVLSHDASIDRMTDGKGDVKDLTLADIKKLRVTSPDPADKKVYRIPEFKDVLSCCKDRMNIYLDFKDADPEETYRQIQAAGMEKQVVVYLNKTSQYRPWRKVAPAMPLMTGVPESIKTPEQLDVLLGQVQIEVVDNLRDSAMLAVARRNGVAVWLDVQSSDEGPVSWSQALRRNIQGVQTDHPDCISESKRSAQWSRKF
jgi:glycerophosphoryl diester phosphodiesterase